MLQWKPVLLCFLAVSLAACEAPEANTRTSSADAKPFFIDQDASPEDLYFEVARLQSAGLVDSGRMRALQASLDEVDARYEGSEDHREQLRQVIATTLRRTYDELRRGEDRALVEAREGQAYAQRLHQTGVREAQQYAEGSLLVAGMLGVPTSKGDVLLMVVVPVGGHVVMKMAGVALKHVPFLLRRFRTADEVVEGAKKLGLRPRYVSTREELRQLEGDAAAKALDNLPPHVGAGGGRSVGKENRWNPSARNDNCTACVASVIRNSLEGYFKYSADEIERLFGYTGRERRFTPQGSLDYLVQATGMKASPQPVSMLDKGAPVGHYAVFTRWEDGNYHHVVYGRVTLTGQVNIFDPQTMEHMTYQQMLKKYGKAMPYLLEAR
ncbi:hypothetical protein F0U62_11305 [Cystobacter fuscus]|uniref:hypothetical protein n=1 Tax=Cystobacter fuscus TaxID=43 RepID=UPI002B2AD33F|nr:hypothetical protein F0U62_11305 [Cystobacter fuscus]